MQVEMLEKMKETWIEMMENNFNYIFWRIWPWIGVNFK